MVPFYNPGTVVRSTIERAATALAAAGAAAEIIAVCDGATDGSLASLEGLLPDVLRTVVLEVNRGKGYAVRAGMAQAAGRLVGFIDADGDIAPEVLADFVRRADATGADILFGSKRHPGAQPHAPLVRRLSSSAYRLLVRALFRLGVPDTQTGVKLLRAEVAAGVLPDMVEDRYAFDLELFVLARQLGFRHFLEVPVTVDKQYTSTISVGAARTIVGDTLKIFWRFRVRRSAARRQPGQVHRVDAPGRVPDEDVDPR